MLNLNEDPSVIANAPEEALSRFEMRKTVFLRSIRTQAIKRAYSKVGNYSRESIKNPLTDSRNPQKSLKNVDPSHIEKATTRILRNPDLTIDDNGRDKKSTIEKEMPPISPFVLQKKFSNESDYSDEQSVDISMKSDSKPRDKMDKRRSLFNKSEKFRRHIMSIARINREKGKSARFKILLTERETNLDIFQKVNLLRYRENVYKAASQLTTSLPPFPTWAYKNRKQSRRNVLRFNISGTNFEVYDDTLMNLPHTKLSENYLYHSKDSTMFFDRDATCFNAVLNFYRTGRLHAPASSCLSFFHEELLFWGINEDLMEPCCYSDYQASIKTCDTLDSYMESMKKPLRETSNTSLYKNVQHKYKMIGISEHSGIFSRCYIIIYLCAIIMTFMTMIIGTTAMGRIDKVTQEIGIQMPNEKMETYFMRTEVNTRIKIIDILLNAFFLVDFVTRLIFTSDKLLFFSDILNWADLLVIISSILSDLPTTLHAHHFETYPLILKVPRIFRIFRMTKNIRIGMDAFILTLRASFAELMLVFTIFFIAICFYGVLIYVVEIVNEEPGESSSFKTIYDGMWWAIATMATIGYGDFVPHSSYGFIVGYFSILTGIIIIQLPVPIFLTNFTIFYNQIQARMQLVDTVLSANINLDTLEQASVQDKSSKQSSKNIGSSEDELPKSTNDILSK